MGVYLMGDGQVREDDTGVLLASSACIFPFSTLCTGLVSPLKTAVSDGFPPHSYPFWILINSSFPFRPRVVTLKIVTSLETALNLLVFLYTAHTFTCHSFKKLSSNYPV